MATTTGFKDIIDLPEWRPLANAPVYSNSTGTAIVNDQRNSEDRLPMLFRTNQNGQLDYYNMKNDGWLLGVGGSSGIGGIGTTGVGMAVYGAQGPAGTLAAGASTTKVILTTALPAAVAANQMANRGDGIGFKIRIIGNSAGGSGKTEERYIVGNTAGTTPTIYLDSALSFTPASGDRYEFLSGKVYILASAVPRFRSFDVLTNTWTTLTVTGLGSFAGATFTSLLSLDEMQTPVDRNPGEGFFGNLVATGSAATTLTGTAAGGDSVITANEYRNFQIRIVQDTAIPTAVGQRRRITSHTAGASPVYTVAAWTVTPSATCTFVIEFDNDKIAAWGSGTVVSNYNIAANTWDTTTWAAKIANSVPGYGGSFGISATNLGTTREARHSFFYTGGSTNDQALNLFDIAGAATGAWTNNITYGGANSVSNNGSNWDGGGHFYYDPATNSGKYVYINLGGSQTGAPGQVYLRFDVRNRVMENWTFRPYPESGGTPLAIGTRMAGALFIDGATKLMFITALRGAAAAVSTGVGTEVFQILAQR